MTKKLSPKDITDFENEFCHEINLFKASFDKNGQTDNIEYISNHDRLIEFHSAVTTWLNENEIPFNTLYIKQEITICTYEKLSNRQIMGIEDEFHVKCSGYLISCNLNEITYNFS